ncbi:MAG TPA: exoprotein, partial [Qipengyuania sp.]|nr:exoprotein [Qipengyuania sp.]
MTGAEFDQESTETIGDPATRAGRWRRKRVLLPGLVVLALVAGLAVAWFSRERIAGNVIESQLEAYGIPATYTIERIGGRRQVLRDVVVGNPAQPDLTVERAEIRIAYRLGLPRIGRITLVRPRLYGRLIGGRVSFGTLDRAIYRDTGEPPGLPEIDLAIQDGRALIRTPYGPVGAKIDGRGLVSDGFAGTLAVAAPSLSAAECRASNVSLFGRITSLAGQPRFVGPVRLAELDCPGRQLALGRTDAQVDLTSDTALASYSGRADIDAVALRYADYRSVGAELGLRGNWKDGLLDVRHTVAARGV